MKPPEAVASGPITPGHSKFTPDQLVGRADRAVATAEDEQDVEDTGVLAQQLGGVSAFSRRVVPPGVRSAAMTMGTNPNRVLDAVRMKAGLSPTLRPDAASTGEADNLQMLEQAEEANPASPLTSGTGAALSLAPALEAGVGVLQALRSRGGSVLKALRAARGGSPKLAPDVPPKTLFDAPKRLLEPPVTVQPTQSPIQTALSKGKPTPRPSRAPRPAPQGEVPQTMERAIETQSPAEAVMESAPQVSRRTALERQFQNVVDEGKAGYEASLHKGTVTPDTPTNWDLMQRMEQGLLNAKGKGARAPRVPDWRRAAGLP